MNTTLVRSVANCVLRIADESGILGRIHRGPGPIVLMYHGIQWRTPSPVGHPAVDREAFVRQMRYLKQRFHILHPNDLKEGIQSVCKNGEQSVVLTFDDGLASNATIAAPILQELRIPAVFFVSTRHLQPRKYLWFMHARALFDLWPAHKIEFMGRTWKLGSTAARKQAFEDFLQETTRVSIDAVYNALSQFTVEDFVSPEIIDQEVRGMTQAELALIAQSDLFVIGSHTDNHPYLTKCTTTQLDEEIIGAKATLEQLCRRPVTMFSYPSGYYNSAITTKVKQAGFSLAFAVSPRCEVHDAKMAIPRVGIYRPDPGIFAAKSYGLFPLR